MSWLHRAMLVLAVVLLTEGAVLWVVDPLSYIQPLLIVAGVAMAASVISNRKRR